MEHENRTVIYFDLVRRVWTRRVDELLNKICENPSNINDRFHANEGMRAVFVDATRAVRTQVLARV